LDEVTRAHKGDGHWQLRGGLDGRLPHGTVRARPPTTDPSTRCSTHVHSWGALKLRVVDLRCLRRSNYVAGEYIAFTSTGNIRAGLPKGRIDSAMASAVVPFGSQMRFVAVNGTVLKLMLENGVSQSGSGRFPALYGIDFEYDPARPAGSRVTDVQVCPQPRVQIERRPWGDGWPYCECVPRWDSIRLLKPRRSWLRKSTCSSRSTSCSAAET
jgi:hypothetical protein